MTAGAPETLRASRDDRLAAALRGFGPAGTATTIVLALLGPIVEPLSALLVLLWRWRSCTPWSALGFVRPRNWLGAAAGGIALGCSFKLIMKSIVMPLLGADPINPAFHHL